MAGLRIINPDMDAVERRLKGLDEEAKPKERIRTRKKPGKNRIEQIFDDW